MDLYRHLFVDGEFAERSRIIDRLSLAQITTRPPGAPHSIFEEFWHLTRWQHVVVYRDEEAYEEWEKNKIFPLRQAASMDEWQDLVREYEAGVEEVMAWAASPERLAEETDPGVTMADNLMSLAVHSAHHFGKMLALRQQMGAW